MLIPFVTLNEEGEQAELVEPRELGLEGSTIYWRRDVPLESVAFDEWLEAWHRAHNPDDFTFRLIEKSSGNGQSA